MTDIFHDTIEKLEERLKELDEELIVSNVRYTLHLEHLKEVLPEIVTALNFMHSLGWENYDESEPEFQCQKSLSDFLFRMNYQKDR